MLVSRDQLSGYAIPEDLWFNDRIERDQFFINYPDRLTYGLYCAIGNDENGWELEQFDGYNWAVASIDSSYTLIITNDGLKALADADHGTYQVYITGIKIINSLIKNPEIPLVQWTDSDLLNAGDVVFSCGTNNAGHSSEVFNKIFKWRYNTSTGGLQYILTLESEGESSLSDNNAEEWEIGAVGLYVKDPNTDSTDILFGVACLQSLVTKYSTTINRIGNTVKLNFNTVLSNLGFVSNLEVIESAEQNIPEVCNESLLLYPENAYMRPHNCYLIDNLYGTGIPALAVPTEVDTAGYGTSWTYFQPSQNFINVDPTAFDSNVGNYMFVYWDNTDNLYKLAEGIPDTTTSATNPKMPMGIRVGNSIVYEGEINNKNDSYQYTLALSNGGYGYKVNDELLILAKQNGNNDSLTLKLIVTSIDTNGIITDFNFIGPTSSDIDLFNGSTTQNTIILPATYDGSSSPLPHNGEGARFIITQTKLTQYNWNFPEEWVNKPLYCSYTNDPITSTYPNYSAGPGKPTLTITDSFLGWCTSTNSIRLALDLRNRASTTNYGTTRYATDNEVKNSLSNAGASQQTSVTPKALKDNYLQITKSTNNNQPGDIITNPIEVQTFVHFNQVVMGKGTQSPYNTTNNPKLDNNEISFYGLAYRSWFGDLAEFYESDEKYEAGTLVVFGRGKKEISIATDECNGIVSYKPGYQLGDKKSDYHLPVALTGRVPVRMDGYCMPKFGDKIYLSKLKNGCASTVENGKCLGKVIEKDFGTSKLIECVVRIEF